MTSDKVFVLASRNTHKIQELASLLKPLNVDLKSSLDFDELSEVEEDGDTLYDNARKKAVYTFQELNLPAIADDTGLEVDALNGEPGVYSARYAGSHATYQENVQKILSELQKSDAEPPFTARFKTVLSYIDSEKEWWCEGVCEGEIILLPRGDAGFGYDPVFVPKGYNQTFAELSEETKNAISHRGRAMAEFVQWLQDNERS